MFSLRQVRSSFAQTQIPDNALKPGPVRGAATVGASAAPSAATADKETQFMSRPKPKLANGVSLCDETRQLLKGEQLGAVTPTVLPTSYGRRPGHTPAQNLAANLMLDVHMHFEEQLQKKMEHLPGALGKIKKIVELMHPFLGDSGLPTDFSKMSAADLTELRLARLKEQLADYFPKEALDEYFAKREGTDAALEHLAASATERPGEYQIAQMKLLKMLFGQLPYFGGSVQYKLGKKDTVEHWIYHISSITRDAARSLETAEGKPGYQMIKGMRDYMTPDGSPVPHNNQRNLGTGVAESEWRPLPPLMRADLVAQFKANLDHANDSLFGRDVIARKKLAYTRVLAAVQARVGRPIGADDGSDIDQVWDHLLEDEKKTVHGFIAALPWENAHIEGLQGSFEVDTDINAAQREHAWLIPHPNMHGTTGVMNVAGVHGNVLEIPEAAFERYMAKSEDRFGKTDTKQILRPDGSTITISNEQLRDDFVGKQQQWFDRAYANHQPIVGGMSGHALAYLNLYKDALRDKPEGVDAPSMEFLRALMVGVLVGNKRHHSYNEVMAPTVGMPDGDGRMSYQDMVGYNDLLDSPDAAISHAARQALDAASAEYELFDRGTVLATLCDNSGLSGPARDELHQALKDIVAEYHAAMKDSRSDNRPFVDRMARELESRLPADRLRAPAIAAD